MSNKFTQIYLATLNKKAEDAISNPPFGYYPDTQMNDSVPGWMGRGGDADVLTPKPLGLQAPFVSRSLLPSLSPARVYLSSNQIDDNGINGIAYINAPGGIDNTNGIGEQPALRPGFPQTVRSSGIPGAELSLGNIPPDPTPQLRATPPGLRPDPSALGKKAEAFPEPGRFTLEGSRPSQGAAPEILGSRPSSFTLEHTAARPTTGLAFTSGVDLPAPAPTILDLLIKNRLLAGAGLAAAGAAGYMGYKALSKKKKKKGDDDDDDKTASFTEAYYNGRKGPQSYADTYIAAFHKRAQDEPLSAIELDYGNMASNTEAKKRLQQTLTDVERIRRAPDPEPLTRRQREEELAEEDRGNIALGAPLRPSPYRAPKSRNPINIASDTVMNGAAARQSAPAQPSIQDKVLSAARSAGNQIKSTATSAGNAISDAYGRANDSMGSKLAPVIYPKVYEEAAGVDRNIPILMENSRFAKAIAPFDPKAPPKPGRQLSAFSRLGTPGFSKNKLNPPPQLTGLVNSAAQNMNPSISVSTPSAAPRWNFTPSANP